jgi:hypothetical protein
LEVACELLLVISTHSRSYKREKRRRTRTALVFPDEELVYIQTTTTKSNGRVRERAATEKDIPVAYLAHINSLGLGGDIYSIILEYFWGLLI